MFFQNWKLFSVHAGPLGKGAQRSSYLVECWGPGWRMKAGGMSERSEPHLMIQLFSLPDEGAHTRSRLSHMSGKDECVRFLVVKTPDRSNLGKRVFLLTGSQFQGISVYGFREVMVLESEGTGDIHTVGRRPPKASSWPLSGQPVPVSLPKLYKLLSSKQCHLLGTKCPNTWACGGNLPFKPQESAYDFQGSKPIEWDANAVQMKRRPVSSAVSTEPGHCWSFHFCLFSGEGKHTGQW